MDKTIFDTWVDVRDHLRSIHPCLATYSTVALVEDNHDLITRINNVLKADNRPHCLESGEHGEFTTSGHCVDCGEPWRGK